MAHFVVCVLDSTYGWYLWSSSDESQNSARHLITGNGHAEDFLKESYYTRPRVRDLFDLRMDFVVKFGVFSGLREVSLYV